MKRVSNQQLIADVDQSSKFDPESITTSPDLAHFAVILQAGAKQSVQHDNRHGGQFDQILHPLIFSPDGKRLAYNAVLDRHYYVVIDQQEFGPFEDITKGGTWFSPDSQHAAFGYCQGGEWSYFVDGEKQGPFAGVGVGVFSPDSQHLGYKARLLSASKQCLVLNGSAGPLFDHVDDPRFSPDSRRTAYAAKTGSDWCAVLDGQPGINFKEVYISPNPFSPDSRHFGHVIIENRKYSVWMDGKLHGPYDRLYHPDSIHEQMAHPGFLFSPDSQQSAWIYKVNKEFYIHLNEQKLGPYDNLGEFIFSPDARHYAYLRGEEKRRFGISRLNAVFVVRDGIESRGYDVARNPVFSPDSQRFAFGVEENKRAFQVIDNKPGKSYETVAPLIFSPDSQHAVYGGKTGSSRFVVFNDEEYGPYFTTNQPAFSPDSKFIVYRGFQVFQGMQEGDYGMRLFVNCDPGELYTTILSWEGKVAEFLGPESFRYLAYHQNSFLRIEETVSD